MTKPPGKLEHLLSHPVLPTSPLAPAELEVQTRRFLLMFSAAAQAESDREESWAYQKMRQAFLTICGGEPSTDPEGLPAGMWEAMKWAAAVAVAQKQTRSLERGQLRDGPSMDRPDRFGRRQVI
jgi:hypothetical protein